MKTVLCLVAMLGLAAVGCGNNDCEDALDKIDECDIDLGPLKPTDDEASECNSKDECVAKCINDASCSEIEAAIMGTSNSAATCIQACPD